ASKLTSLQRTRVPWQRRSGTLPSHRQQEVGIQEPIQRLAHLELAQSRVAYQAVDVAVPVDEREQRFLLGRQRVPIHHQTGSVEAVHHVEARDLLFDQRPLVYSSGALEQQRLGIHRHALRAVLGLNALL